MNILDIFKNYDPNIINRPYVIAEAGVNHEGDIELAKRMINEAAKGGAHAIKFQTYKADKLAAKDSPSYWDLSKEPTKIKESFLKNMISSRKKNMNN